MITKDDLDLFTKGITKRLTLKGESNEFQAYKIPLDKLKYNVKNDRIASFITQYYDDNQSLPINSEELNKEIEPFIINSNPDAFKKTRNNIKAIGQMEAAVVLSDGIVIDGNRRFTALRQLSKETGQAEFDYIEAVVLDREKYNDKDIKRLELNLQHAAESKVQYNPIDWLVGIYRDLVKKGHLFSPEEYAAETQLSLNKLREEINISKLLVEYLEYIQQPEKFHVARKQKVDGPIREVYKILRSNKIDNQDKDYIKEYLFSNLLTLDGDVTRIIRDLKPVFEDKSKLDRIIDDSQDILDEIDEQLINTEEDTSKRYSESVDIAKDVRNQLNNLTEEFIDEDRVSKAQYQPVDALRLALNHLDRIDTQAISYFSGDIKEDFERYLADIENQIDAIRENLHAE